MSTKYAIEQVCAKEECYYLNHANLQTLGFGAYEMAWTGTQTEAYNMLKSVKKKYKGKYMRFRIVPACEIKSN